jgi:hypothetical protein
VVIQKRRKPPKRAAFVHALGEDLALHDPIGLRAVAIVGTVPDPLPRTIIADNIML